MKTIMQILPAVGQALKTIVLASVIGLGAAYAMAWTGPVSAPPAGNTPAPINVGSSPQAKQGIFETYNDSYFATLGGRVGIGTANPGEKLEVAGNVKASAFLYSSDIRLKKNIKKIPDALGKILKLEGVSFEWNENNKEDVGLIAQDVEKVFSELVSTDKNTGLKSVQYGNLVAPLIESIKQQQQQIEALRDEIEKLKNNSSQ